MEIKKKYLSTAFKVCISCAFFSILLSFVQGNELLKILERIDWLFLSFSFLLIPVTLSASCMKWKVVLGRKARDVSFWQLMRIYMVGYFFSNLLPSTVGGDVVRSYYSGRLLGNQAFAAVSIFVERFTGIFFLFFLVIFAPLLHPGLYHSPFIYIPACTGFSLVCLTVWMWMVKNPLALPEKILALLFGALYRLTSPPLFAILNRGVKVVETACYSILKRLGKVREEFRFFAGALREDRMYVSKIVFLTILFYILTWVNVYIAFRAFGVRPNFVDVCALVPTILFAAHIPITLLGNLGYLESVFVFYFLMIGVSGAETLAMGLLLRVRMLSMGLIGYFMYLFYTHKRPEEFEDLERLSNK